MNDSKQFTLLVLLALMMQMNDGQYDENKAYTIVILGSSGAGKSSLLNFLGGQYVFPVGDGIYSETNSTICKFSSLNCNIKSHIDTKRNETNLLRLVDTQGVPQYEVNSPFIKRCV
jgi:predicted GTPase